MSSNLYPLQELWQATPGPDEQTFAAARARLLEEMERERGSTSGHARAIFTWRGGSFRRQLSLVAAAVVVLVLLVVGVAFTFGLGLPVLDFGQAQKAPPQSRVVKNFAVLDQGAPPGMATDVIPNETRKVATFGNETLWVAPTRQGGFCMDLGGEGGCDRLGTVPLNVSWATEHTGSLGARSDASYHGLPVVDQVSGDINARWADALEIRFEDGDVIKPHVIWVSKPIEAGFFVQPIPLAHRRPGHLLSAVVALDRNGELVASDSLDRNRFNAPPPDAILDQAREVARIETRNGPAVLRTAPTRYEGRCAWLELAGKTYSNGCAFKGYGFEGFGWGFIRTSDDILIFGAAGPNYATIELRYADGDTTQFSPTKYGFLLYELPAPHLQRGAQLTEVTALSATGKTIVKEPLPPSEQQKALP
jgi:hypothetical protein